MSNEIDEVIKKFKDGKRTGKITETRTIVFNQGGIRDDEQEVEITETYKRKQQQ